MKLFSFYIFSIVTTFLLSIFPSYAQCQLFTNYTTSKNCGQYATYIGPNKPEVHGGVCVKISNNCLIKTKLYFNQKLP